MDKWGLGDKRAMMELRRAGLLSSVLVASMEGAVEFMRTFILKISWRFVGGVGFYSVCMRCSQRVY
jgi:hypothetical protein